MIEHEKPGNFPSSKRASKASSEPCTFPGSAGVRRAGSGRNGALHNFLVFGMARGASDAKRLSAKIATSDHRKKGKMPRQRLGPSSPSERPIHFGESLAETAQTRQKLGVSCDLIRNKGFASITPTMVRTETKQWCGTRPKETRQTRKQLNCFVFAFLPESPICDVGAWIGSGPGRALTKCGSCALIGGPVKPGNAPSAAAVP